MRRDADDDQSTDPEHLRDEWPWALEIVRDCFSAGLAEICDEGFLRWRFARFQTKQDPIYWTLMDGMNDPALGKTFVNYRTIGQTIATQSRFWLEAAIARIIIHQTRHFGRQTSEVYTHSLLAQGWPSRRVEVADPEDELEHLMDHRPWRVPVQRHALENIDVLVGQQERESPQLAADGRRIRDWSQELDIATRKRDIGHFTNVARSLIGPPVSSVTLQCNLLVIEPDKLDRRPHVWALRFVNPKVVASHPNRKQERVNLLRLYAYLVQEKVLRDPSTIQVAAAELVPRRTDYEGRDRYPDYFSWDTYWSSQRLWDFVGVPFEAIRLAIADAAQELRDRLKAGLRELLPEHEPSAERGQSP